MRTNWIEISCSVPESMVDLIAEYLVELSSCGVSIENLSVDTFTTENIASSPIKTIRAYFAEDTSVKPIIDEITAFLKKKGDSFPEYVFTPPVVVLLGEEDWANNWKVHFKPSRIGRHLVIKPTWEDYAAAPDDIVIELDPGQAFGTGTHPTTRLCLEALEIIMTATPSLATVLDVGTGSGVLSIAAAKLGARLIHAIDIDPEAVRVASENLSLNRVGMKLSVGIEPVDEVQGEFGVVLANIIAEELVKLAPELPKKVARGGYLILSGILDERETFVRHGFDLPDLAFQEVTRLEEWCCLTYRRNH